ncbi:BMP family protein [Thermoactinomyces sp. DSM 45892]|uniref:BMP family lipoprotein n=1 Tax=Thermoactinomyces sp. DSM 45892 TaxID=1882753 RepID=UPI0008982C35|nr:BMP family protein [Thermoactinomyces sp. DSM 45892]SDY48593.1 nucleoside-binding protein [Thermoactinomyces sp. DSM 45892]
MQMKRWLGSLVAVSLVATLAVGCGGNNDKGTAKGDFSVGLVTDTGGLNDESFNQSANMGLQKAKNDLKVDVKAQESKKDDDYVPNLTRFAKDKRNLIWGVGFKFNKALPEVADKFKDSKFAIVDDNLGGKVPSNVVAVTFKDEEGSYLAGIAAGKTTKTNQVGFIGGITSPLVKKFEAGFTAGVKEANPKATVKAVYAESFTDATKGRSLAKSLYDGGADIVYHAAGGVGKGLFDEVKTRQAGKYWAIGVDMDQSRLAPEHTLTSMIKRVDVAVFEITKQAKEGTLKTGTEVNFGLKDEGVGLSKSSKVSPEVMKQVEEYKQKIIKGEITVPSK